MNILRKTNSNFNIQKNQNDIFQILKTKKKGNKEKKEINNFSYLTNQKLNKLLKYKDFFKFLKIHKKI